MRRDAVSRILSGAREKTIAVWGDLMLDQFIWGTVDRISPEAPVPVVRTTHETYHLGGAGNVAANIVALGARALPLGIIGEGPYATRLSDTLRSAGIDTRGVLRVTDRLTTVKSRVVAHNQQVVRFDREQDDPIDEATVARLRSAVDEIGGEVDALIVSDYEKGCVDPRLLESILPRAKERGIPVVIDPKPAHWRSYGPCTVIAPNISEASRMSGIRIRTETDLNEAGRRIRETLGCRGVLLTRGEKGMVLIEGSEEPFAIAATSREVFDVTGAGDTVVATLALGLAAGCALREAAVIANAAAGVVVGKVGTAVASPGEVAASFD